MYPVNLFQPDSPTKLLISRGTAAVARAEFWTRAQTLAAELPRKAYVFNLAENRYLFMLGLAAGWLRGHISLLPPDRAPNTIAKLHSEYRDSYCFPVAGSGDIVPNPGVSQRCDAADGRSIELRASQPAVLVFTSGSTGVPTSHIKSIGALAEAAGSIARRLALDTGDESMHLIATVPHQHMYGLETSVMLALVANCTAHNGRPFYPIDVCTALSAVPPPRLLITTPLHIRALLGSGLKLPALYGVLSATAPLSLELAAEAEHRFGCPLWEIYGFSEAGSVATRRTIEGPAWHLLDCVRSLRQSDGTVAIAADYLPKPVPFPDDVSWDEQGRLLLLGRGSDVVNIGGHRASLQDLNNKLVSIAGVEDGVFVPPVDCNAAGARLVAFVVAPRRTLDDVLNAIREIVDPAFLPRPLYLVSSLPRNATGKLTRQALEHLALNCRRSECARGE